MWIAEQMARGRGEKPAGGAELGVVTIGGAAAAAEIRGEERGLPIYGPGGLVWRPRPGDQVLVVKACTDGAERCIIAMAPVQAPEGMEAGELWLGTESASLWLRRDGSLALRGKVEIQGELWLNGQQITKEQ